jgi:hypothetical protein
MISHVVLWTNQRDVRDGDVRTPASLVSFSMSTSGGPLFKQDQATLRTLSSFSVKVGTLASLDGVCSLLGDAMVMLGLSG